jgi:predicted dehydrogenase
MSSQTHRIAIAGVGGISAMHAHSIAELPNAQLVAGCCRTAQKGRAFAETHGCAWHPDVEQMLDTERPDVLCITTPSGAHLPPAEAAFARGVHVLCEKPLEITTERVDAMIEHAREAGVTLGGIFPQRFNPACQPLFEAAREGRFGAPASVQAAVPWWRDDAYYAPQRWQGTRALDGGGALMNQSIHDVDLVQWLGGAAARGAGASVSETENPVAEVFAYTGRRGHDAALLEVEDTAVVVLRHQDGGLGQILASTALYPGTSKRFQIGGRFGTAELVGDRLSCYHFAKERA